MKQAIISIIMVVLLVFISIGFFSASQSAASPVSSQGAVVSCTDVNVGQQVRITCTAAGVVVLNTTVNLPQVEVTVPGAPVTIRVPVPGEEQTVRVPVPGPTETVTVRVPADNGGSEPSATVTVTETVTQTRPEQTPTSAPARPDGPTPPPATQTTTVAPEPRQGATTPATIEPTQEEDDSVVTIPETNLNTPQAVGIGTLTLLLIAGLILAGMYAGYYMGYKDSEKAEADFFRSLLRK